MAIRERLKGYFETGDKPTEENFRELIEAFVTLEEAPFEKGDAENSVVLKGGDNKATGVNSLSAGRGSNAGGECAAAFGNSVASGDFSHSEGGVSSSGSGRYTKAIGRASHAEGEGCHASSNGAHAEGIDTDAKMMGSHTEGYQTQANAQYSHAEGVQAIAGGNASHAEGKSTVTTNIAEHAQGQYNASNPETIHSVGIGKSNTNRYNAHEIMQDGRHYIYGIGGYNGANPGSSKTIQEVIGDKQDALKAGTGIVISPDNTISCNLDPTTSIPVEKGSGENSVVQKGSGSKAGGKLSFAEGYQTQANAQYSHAEGVQAIAGGNASHAEGKSTVTTNIAEHAQGQYNASNPETIHSVGIGKSNTNRYNAHEIMQDGRHYIYGIGGYNGANPNPGEGIQTVQEVIKSLENRIAELESILNK